MSASGTGYFQFCVDIGLPENRTALAQHREMNLLVEQLAGTFARHDIVATWATNQSVNSPIANIIRSADERHELALLGDSSWLSSSISREKTIDHFSENMAHAAELGKPLTTLVLRDGAPEALNVVFKKRGIDTLRPVVTDSVARRATNPTAPRASGLWVTPTTGLFPARGRVLGRFDLGFRGKQILHRARSRGTTEQLTIVASEMMEQPTACLRALDKILRFAAKFEQLGSVRIETLRQATARRAPQRKASQRSVLRPAA